MSWTVSDHVVWLETAEGIQLYDTTSGEFQTLNTTGSAVWRCLADSPDTDQLLGSLAAEFHATDDNHHRIIARDTKQFLDELVEQGILRTSPSGA
jgi:hypothetical protein